MTRDEVNRWIESSELDKRTLLDEQFDNAIVGSGNCDTIIYDIDKMIDILLDQGKTADEAIEYLDENYFSKHLKTIFMSFYNKEIVDTHFWVKNLCNKYKKSL